MLTIKTKPDCTLGFVECPPNIENKWVENLQIQGSIYMEGPNLGEKTELEGKLIIGKLSEITEEQAKELVETKDLFYKNYSEPYCVCVGADGSLNSAALSVGIEEKDFDKYLVIKL